MSLSSTSPLVGSPCNENDLSPGAALTGLTYRPVGTKLILGGGAVNKANCTGLRENFCSATPFRLLESNLAIQIAIFNG